MRYRILIALTVEAAPADLGSAADKGFQAVADLYNEGKPITIHLLPQDGSAEAQIAEKVLNACFTATSTPEIH
jgi:hypothetical protein